MSPRVYHRLQNVAWPSWMFNSVQNSFYRIVKTIKEEIDTAVSGGEGDGNIGSESDSDQESTALIVLPHPEFTAKVTFEESMGSFRKNLQKTRPLPPPPKGHMQISGIVQIVGEKIVVHVDVDATFDPETCNDYIFQNMKVRWVARAPSQVRERTKRFWEQRAMEELKARQTRQAQQPHFPPHQQQKLQNQSSEQQQQQTTQEQEQTQHETNEVSISPPRGKLQLKVDNVPNSEELLKEAKTAIDVRRERFIQREVAAGRLVTAVRDAREAEEKIREEAVKKASRGGAEESAVKENEQKGTERLEVGKDGEGGQQR